MSDQKNNNERPKISVVTPAYKRADYLETLLKSYLAQQYSLANVKTEFVVVDDSMEDNTVRDMVASYISKNPAIKYIKNETNRGFCKNLLKSIVSGSGEYILVMGDDDMFISPDVLQKYIDIFDTNQEVGFIYSNQIQFNNSYVADYLYKHFSSDTYYKTTEESLKHIWLLSCFISGIGLRNNVDFASLYPKENILFPQVELIGKILGTQQAFGFGQFLIGSRAHNQQLGFAAVNNKNIKGNEKHSVHELNEIYAIVLDYYKNVLGKPLALSNNFVNQFFENNHMTIFPSEKINSNNATILKVFQKAVQNNPKVLVNPMFMGYFLISLLTPSKYLLQLKEWRKKQYIRQFPAEVEKFNLFVKEICKQKQ